MNDYNPYVTITPKEYTKHYYANGERLATSIGQGGWCFTSPDVISNPQTEHEVVVRKLWHDIYSGQYPFEYPHEPMPEMTKNVDIADNPGDELQYRCPIRHLQRLKIDYEPNILLGTMQNYCEAWNQEKDIFYTHGDHLGSACWITSFDGKPIQYMHYLPYGQLLANQTPYGYDERYKFTGKERDAETGYDFFGARYYWALFKHWTKVDPLVDNYLHISPYAYCNWNPITHRDPNGMVDMRVVGRGLFVSSTGVASVIGGANLAGLSGGIAAPLGALLIVDGVSSVGLGLSMMMYGLFTDPGEKNTQLLNTMPTSATNALAKSADVIAGNSNSEIENIVDGVMIVAGGTPNLEKVSRIYSGVMTTLQVGDKVLDATIESTGKTSENSPYQTGVTAIDNTRVDVIELLQPIPYNCQSTQSFEVN